MSRPIEAAARPFPREETTPPVMKMYLVGTLISSCGSQGLLDHPDVFGGVHPVIATARSEHLDSAPTLEGPELLQPFESLQMALAPGGELQQERASECVQTDVSQPRPGSDQHVTGWRGTLGPAPHPPRLRLRNIRDWAARKVQGRSPGVAHDLDDVRVLGLLRVMERSGQRRLLQSGIRFQTFDEEVDVAGIEERLVPLDIDEDIRRHRGRDLRQAIGPGG